MKIEKRSRWRDYLVSGDDLLLAGWRKKSSLVSRLKSRR
jgi:hypothetical protein